MWALICMSAQAGVIEAWSVDDFGNDTLPAQSGWTAGYETESWYGYQGYLVDVGDENIEDNGYDYDGSDWPGFGAGTAADNWLVRGEELAQQVISLEFANTDDDTFGVVAALSAPGTFYVVAHTGDSSPPPVLEVNNDQLFLLRVEGGQAEELASEGARLSNDDWNRLRVTLDDGQITVMLNGELVLQATDPAPLPAGQAGVYSYDNGYENRDEDLGYVESLSVGWQDEDDDGVADDTDNCEELANEDQADADEDGLGDVCDPSPNGDPTRGDTGSTATSGSDTGLPSGGDSGGAGGTVVLESAGCGCSAAPLSSPAVLGGLFLGLAGLVTRRRSR